jgi:hypothetical protein
MASHKIACWLTARGSTQDFSPGGSKAYMPKKVPNVQRIINNNILKIVHIVFSRGQLPPLPHAVYGPANSLTDITQVVEGNTLK